MLRKLHHPAVVFYEGTFLDESGQLYLVMELVPLRCGMPVTFSHGLMSLPQEIKALKPTILLAPPRLWGSALHPLLRLQFRAAPT